MRKCFQLMWMRKMVLCTQLNWIELNEKSESWMNAVWSRLDDEDMDYYYYYYYCSSFYSQRIVCTNVQWTRTRIGWLFWPLIVIVWCWLMILLAAQCCLRLMSISSPSLYLARNQFLRFVLIMCLRYSFRDPFFPSTFIVFFCNLLCLHGAGCARGLTLTVYYSIVKS